MVTWAFDGAGLVVDLELAELRCGNGETDELLVRQTGPSECASRAYFSAESMLQIDGPGANEEVVPLLIAS